MLLYELNASLQQYSVSRLMEDSTSGFEGFGICRRGADAVLGNPIELKITARIFRAARYAHILHTFGQGMYYEDTEAEID